MFDSLYNGVVPAVKAVAGRYAKFGFGVDDCLQEAAVCVLGRLAASGGEAIDPRYVKKCVLNHLATLPRKCDSFCEAAEGDGPAEARACQIDWDDLIRSAPGSVREYLQARVVDQLSWEDTRARFGLSDRGLSALRTDVASWVLAQFEGRKTCG